MLLAEKVEKKESIPMQTFRGLDENQVLIRFSLLETSYIAFRGSVFEGGWGVAED